jgi:hypothetical protein
MEMIEPDARRGDAEHVRRAPVEVRVELDLQVVGLLVLVAPGHRRLHRHAGRAEHARANPQRGVVIQEPDLHCVGRRRSFHRLRLEEIGDRLRSLPRLLVETSIELERLRSGPRGACLLAAALRLLRGRRGGPDERDGDGKKDEGPGATTWNHGTKNASTDPRRTGGC